MSIKRTTSMKNYNQKLLLLLGCQNCIVASISAQRGVRIGYVDMNISWKECGGSTEEANEHIGGQMYRNGLGSGYRKTRN